jgi:hypothetical protein
VFCDAETTPLISEKFLAFTIINGICYWVTAGKTLQKHQPARNFRKFIPFLEVMFGNAFDEGKTCMHLSGTLLSKVFETQSFSGLQSQA